MENLLCCEKLVPALSKMDGKPEVVLHTDKPLGVGQAGSEVQGQPHRYNKCKGNMRKGWLRQGG